MSIANMSGDKRLFLGFAPVLALTAGIGLVSLQYTRSMAGDFESLYMDNLQAVVNLSNAERGLWELRFGIANYEGWNTTDRAKTRAEESRWTRQIEENMKAYGQGNRSPEEKDALKEFDDWCTKYLAARPHWFDLIDEDPNAVKALSKLIAIQTELARADHC